MSERVRTFINRPYGLDEDFCFRYGSNFEKKLYPCEPIEDKSLCLAIIDNSNLKPHRLLLTDKDRKTIKVTIPSTSETVELNFSGKSAIIVLQPELCDKDFLKETVEILLSSKADRQDHIHVARVSEIENAGWIPFGAPLQLERKIPHVRLVARRTLISGEDPSVNDATSLVNIFERIPNLHG